MSHDFADDQAAESNDPAELAELAQHCRESVAANVAKNRNTPPRVLMALALHPTARVRLNVAFNPHAPVAALLSLSRDPEGLVRLRVAMNPSTPLRVLAAMAMELGYRCLDERDSCTVSRIAERLAFGIKRAEGKRAEDPDK